jgi:hypothetical protein
MIKWIIIALLGLIVLGYLGFDVRKAVEAPVTQTNIEYVKNAVIYVWGKYLARPASYLWNEIFIKLIWTKAVDVLTKVKDVEPINTQVASPHI